MTTLWSATVLAWFGYVLVAASLARRENAAGLIRQKRAAGDKYKSVPESLYSVNNRFKKISDLKAGEFGLVLLATDTKPLVPTNDKDCVIKVAELDANEYLQKEVNMLKAVADIDGFPRLLYPDPKGASPKVGIGTHNNVKYEFYAMSRVGPDLWSLLTHDIKNRESNGKAKTLVNVHQAVLFMQKVYASMFKLHEKGIAHNDLHGGNLCVSRDSKEAIIIDFGKATSFDKAAAIQNLKRGPFRDYLKLQWTMYHVLCDVFIHDKFLQSLMKTKSDEMCLQMFKGFKWLKEEQTFTNLADLRAKIGNKIDTLLKTQAVALANLYPPEKDSIAGALTSWKKGDECAAVNDGEFGKLVDKLTAGDDTRAENRPTKVE